MNELITEIIKWRDKKETQFLCFFVSEEDKRQIEGDLILSGFTNYQIQIFAQPYRITSDSPPLSDAVYKVIVGRIAEEG